MSKLIAIALLVYAQSTWSAVAAQAPTVVHTDDAAIAPPIAPLFHPSSRFTLKEPLTSIVAPPADSGPFAQHGWGRGHWDHHAGARAAIILGSAAAIAGGALLIYANRPDCGANHSASGCGYGTKVTGGALVAGGLVSITVGAITWH